MINYFPPLKILRKQNMKKQINIIIGGDTAKALATFVKTELKEIAYKQIGGLKKDYDILIWDEPEPKGHSIDINGNCNKVISNMKKNKILAIFFLDNWFSIIKFYRCKNSGRCRISRDFA